MSMSEAVNTGTEPITVEVPGEDESTIQITVPPGSVLIYDTAEDNGDDLTEALATAGAAITTIGA